MDAKLSKKKKKLNLNVAALLDSVKQGKRGKKLGVDKDGGDDSDSDAPKRSKIKKSRVKPTPAPAPAPAAAKKKKKKMRNDPLASDSDSMFGDGGDSSDSDVFATPNGSPKPSPANTPPASPKAAAAASPKTAAVSVQAATVPKKKEGRLSKIFSSAKKALGFSTPEESTESKLKRELSRPIYKNKSSDRIRERLESGGKKKASLRLKQGPESPKSPKSPKPSPSTTPNTKPSLEKAPSPPSHKTKAQTLKEAYDEAYSLEMGVHSDKTKAHKKAQQMAVKAAATVDPTPAEKEFIGLISKSKNEGLAGRKDAFVNKYREIKSEITGLGHDLASRHLDELEEAVAKVQNEAKREQYNAIINSFRAKYKL